MLFRSSGVAYMWNDKLLLPMFMVLLAVNFLLMGPLMVGIPVLADRRLPEGAAAFGLLMSAFAGGNLAGYLLAGSLPRPSGNNMRWIMVACIASFGLVIGSLGFISYTWVDFGLLLLLGLGNGYIAILLMTWMQTRTPQDMMGRRMSLMMFSSTGLAPISQAAAGVISKWDLTLLFLLPGILVLLVSLWMSLNPELKGLSASMTAAPASIEA